jgi:glycosyltransferase involved in cell wall biosynthesis
MFLILTVINKKTIYFVHSYPNQHLKFYNSLVKTIPRLLRKSSRIITVSQYSKSQLIKYIGFNPRRINVIYNSSNNSSLQNSNQKLSQDIILTLGRLTKIKNPHTWLEVADKVSKLKPNVKFIWVGADKMQKFEMYSLINKKKLNQFVEIIEYVDNPNKYLINASIYFQPSFSESHGISVIDAMSFSLPCVVSKVGGMQESVVQNVTGFLLDPLDVPGFVKRILQLIDDRELAINFGYNGKLMVKRIFSEKIQKKKLTDLYKDVSN